MIGMFKKPEKPSSPWSVGQPLNINLSAAPGVQAGALPTIPSISLPTQSSSLPRASTGIKNNNIEKIIQLLQGFSGGLQ